MSNEEMKLCCQLRDASFAIDDLKLFLDTHCEEPAAMALYQQCRMQRQNAMEELALQGCPMTADQVLSTTKWTWTCAPWPWEGEV